MPTAKPPHSWSYFRVGDLDQVAPSSTADLRALSGLDRKIWVALSCPITGLDFDQRSLELMDSDKDGRVRADEVCAAVDWAADRLKDPTLLVRGADRIPLEAFAENEQGRALAGAARRVLANLNAGVEKGIGPAETGDTAKIFAKTAFNGDGVVTAHQIKDGGLCTLIGEIAACLGTVQDRSGEPGVDLAKAEAFAAELAAFDAWWVEGERASAEGSDTLPLGEATPAAHAALSAVQTKIADWFVRCRLASFDPRAAEPLNRDAAAYAAIASRDLSHLGADIEVLPLRWVETGVALGLVTGINPAWTERMAAFRSLVVEPLLGAGVDQLSESAFRQVAARFASFAAWTTGKKGAAVERLGIARIRELRGGAELQRLGEAIAQDKAVAGDLVGLDDLDRLLRYVRDLGRLLRNFVNFADFYDKNAPAMFQAGVLYLDQRSCELCVRVDSLAAHATLAVRSNLCLVYCDCVRPGGEKLTIAAAMTQGDSDYLMVGRRGIFYDTRGRDWDATVTKLVDNPISIRQAFWSPYKKLIRLVESQLEKVAASKEKALEEQAAAKAQAGVAAAVAPAAAEAKKPAFDVARFAGIFAAIGLALGAIGAAIGALVSAIVQLTWWQQLLVLPGVVLAISLPSMAMAALKLRQRTLGPLLEGSGWAINGRVRITFGLGRALTELKCLPPGSRRSGPERYSEDASSRRVAILLILAALIGGFAIWWTWWGPGRQPGAAPVESEAPVSPPDAG